MQLKLNSLIFELIFLGNPLTMKWQHGRVAKLLHYHNVRSCQGCWYKAFKIQIIIKENRLIYKFDFDPK